LLREEIEQVKTDYPDRFNFMYTVDRPKDGWEYQSGFINKGKKSGFKIGDYIILRHVCKLPPDSWR
jgi:hypothetical protein